MGLLDYQGKGLNEYYVGRWGILGLERVGEKQREESVRGRGGRELFHFPWEAGSGRGRNGYGQRF